MSLFEKTFSVSADTANGLLDVDSFNEEIAQSTIVPGVSHINVLGDAASVFFKADLSASEATTFQGLHQAHQGVSAEPGPSIVTFENVNDTNNVPQMAIVEADGTFNTYVTHNFADTTSWADPTDSCWVLAPPMGTRYRIKRAEVQFQHDIMMNGVTELYFDVWVYNPMDLPNKVLYERKIYKSIMDVMNVGNMHCTMPAVDGMTSSLTTVQFDYPRAIVLDPNVGAEIRVCTKDDTAITGTFCTISFVVGEEPV